MASVISHPAALLALAPIFGQASLGRRALLLGAICTVLPDIDAVGFWLGVPRDSPLGHRGLTHSIAFAAALSAAVAMLAFPRGAARLPVFGFLFLCSVSHGVFDAMTDGSRGIAFFAPFDQTRYFFPWRPIRVSPIGLRRFVSRRGLAILATEAIWIWLPCLGIGLLAGTARRRAAIVRSWRGLPWS